MGLPPSNEDCLCIMGFIKEREKDYVNGLMRPRESTSLIHTRYVLIAVKSGKIKKERVNFESRGEGGGHRDIQNLKTDLLCYSHQTDTKG